jgi:tRNA(Ile2) C34 agmatinyltransferase TiaS
MNVPLPLAAAVATAEPVKTTLCAGCRAPVPVTLDRLEAAEPVACAFCEKKPKCPVCHSPMNSREDARGACGDCERTLPG